MAVNARSERERGRKTIENAIRISSNPGYSSPPPAGGLRLRVYESCRGGSRTLESHTSLMDRNVKSCVTLFGLVLMYQICHLADESTISTYRL